MILRLGPLLLLALLLAVVASQAAVAQTPIGPVAIDVEGTRIALAIADADAFQRRLGQPPSLKTPPVASAPSYTVTADYWDAAVREDEDEPTVDLEAEYFPGGGIVRARQDGKDIWLVLDLRQRAILNRYIRLGSEGAITSAPTALEVMVRAASNEPVGVEVGGRVLSEDEKVSLFFVLDPENGSISPADTPAATGGDGGYWFVFTLAEGRSLQYYYDPEAGTFTDALLSETFTVHFVREAAFPLPGPALTIEQGDPLGSWLWWLLALGGGFAILTLAFWLQRRMHGTG